MVRLLLLVFLALPLWGAVVHVRAGATGAGDGSSWADAFPSLSDALGAAVAGDEVWVAAGTYRVVGDRNSNFPLKDRVPIYGGFLGGETAREQRSRDAGLTVLSGERGGPEAEDNALNVLRGWGGDMLLDGVTVTGNWNDYSYSTIGGALWTNDATSLRLTNCRFVGCAGLYIAAIDARGLDTIRLDDVVIAGNRTTSTFFASNAANLSATTVTLERCLVAGNQAAKTEGSLATVGNCTARDCAVVGNSGGWSAASARTLMAVGCTIAGNTDFDLKQWGVPSDFQSTTLTSCVIGTGFTNTSDTYLATRCWFVASQGAPGFFDPSSPAGADGLWLTADDGYRLAAASPCREGGLNAGASTIDLARGPRLQGRDVDIGAYEYQTGNVAPMATAQSLAAIEDRPLVVALGGSDADGDALTAEITALPAAGILRDGVGGQRITVLPHPVGDPGRVVEYVPAPNMFGAGSGSFTFRLSDGRDRSYEALVAIDVRPVNDAPTIDQPPSGVGPIEDQGSLTVILTGIGPGAGEAQALTITATSGNHALFADPLVEYTPGATTARLRLTPLPDANGSATITVQVRDDGGTADGGIDSATVAFTVPVLAVNDAPVFSVDPAVFGSEDQAAPLVLRLTGVASGPANEAWQNLFISASDPFPGLQPDLVRIGAITIDRAAGTADIQLIPRPDANGSVSLLVSLIDDGDTFNGGVNVNGRMVAVVLAPVNDLPLLAAAGPLRVGVGGTVAVTAADLRLEDVDAPPAAALAFTLSVPPAHGDLRLDGAALAAGATFSQADIDGGRVSYRHRGGDGAKGFAFTWSDGVAPAQGPASITVAVGGKARPVILPGAPGSWREGLAPAAVVPAAVVEDGDSPSLGGGAITATLVAGAAPGDRLLLLDQGLGAGQVSLAGAAVAYGGRPVGTWSGGVGAPLQVALAGPDASPAAVQALVRALAFTSASRDPGGGARTVRLVVDDGDAGASFPVEVAVAVQPVDDPPVVATRRLATVLEAPRIATLQAIDPDSAVLAWAIVAQPANAHAVLLDPAAGTLRIEPLYTGSADLVVSVADGTNPPATAAVAVVVSGPDDPRPHPAGELPRDLYAGEQALVELRWDARDVAGAGRLDFSFTGDPPAGAALVPLGDAAVRVQFAADAADAGRHRSFGVLAAADEAGAAGHLPALLLVRPRPGASQ
ncbi:MAG: hypothetical protein L6R48_17705 [Planctomycetes bacterium]|nr:hypothetical protein [Planctomycetota bacterium]